MEMEWFAEYSDIITYLGRWLLLVIAVLLVFAFLALDTTTPREEFWDRFWREQKDKTKTEE